MASVAEKKRRHKAATAAKAALSHSPAARRGKPSHPEKIALEAAERRAAERAKDAEMEWGISAETLALAEARGEEITAFPARPGEREKPIKRMGGLDWLWWKGRLNTVQMGAGLKYGDDYRMATDVTVRSGSNFDRLGGDGLSIQEQRVNAQKRLAKAHKDGLNDHSEMISLCSMVAGEGGRIRDLAKGNDSEAKAKEAILRVALDMLARHYGMVR